MTHKALIFSASEGHKSLGEAIQQILKPAGWKIKNVDLFDEKSLTRFAGKMYKSFYRFFPFFFRIPFKAGQNNTLKNEINKILENYFLKDVVREINSFDPEIIITTHFCYNQAVAFCANHKIKTFNVLPNPWTIHPLEIQPKMLNLTYDKKSAEICHQLGLPSEKIIQSGWFVRQQFYQQYDRQKFLKSLGFDPKIFTLLICGGSEGSNAILMILPAIIRLKKKVQITIICGTNKLLYNSLKLLINNGSSLLSKSIKLNLVSFTNQMPQYINSADLVVGKAGPNLVFETIAMGKPFFSICHIAGQEDGNLEIIREKKLGFVEENPINSGKLLKKIMENPKLLKAFEEPVNKERIYNQNAGQILLKQLSNL
jgi:UDP-N-acetylglucosamine:LPS N-acetylglucosamine transferase